MASMFLIGFPWTLHPRKLRARLVTQHIHGWDIPVYFHFSDLYFCLLLSFHVIIYKHLAHLSLYVNKMKLHYVANRVLGTNSRVCAEETVHYSVIKIILHMGIVHFNRQSAPGIFIVTLWNGWERSYFPHSSDRKLRPGEVKGFAACLLVWQGCGVWV